MKEPFFYDYKYIWALGAIFLIPAFIAPDLLFKNPLVILIGIPAVWVGWYIVDQNRYKAFKEKKKADARKNRVP